MIMLKPLVRYGDFMGRSRRSEYWLWTLFTLIVAAAFVAAADYAPPSVSVFISTAQLIWGLAILIPGLAVTVRRFHDTRHSGWWTLYLYLIPAVVLHFSVAAYFLFSKFRIVESTEDSPVHAMPPTQSSPYLPVIIGACLAFVLILPVFLFLVRDGTKGPNIYGKDPKGRERPMLP